MKTTNELVVAYHDGGLMFSDDDREYAPGWYLYDGADARPVTVLTPHSNDPLLVDDEQ